MGQEHRVITTREKYPSKTDTLIGQLYVTLVWKEYMVGKELTEQPNQTKTNKYTKKIIPKKLNDFIPKEQNPKLNNPENK